MARPLTVLVASDGSPGAHAAVSLTAHLPWPHDTRAFGVVATATPPAGGLGLLYRDAVVDAYRREAQRLEARLQRRFALAHVAAIGMQPVDAILAEQRKRRAHVIVVGSRGLGIFGRFPLGSVSRRLIRAAPCAVIVTKRAPREVRRVTIAVDGSASSARAVAFVKRLNAPKRGRILLVGVVPPVPLPLMGRAPASIRSEVARHVTAKQQKREAALRRRLQNAAEALRQTGWAVTVDVRRGTPVVEILRAATSWRAEILAFGARNTRGLNRFLLGSVADGLVSRAPMSIFVAK